MRKIKEEEVRGLLRDLEEMRGYLLSRAEREVDGAHIRMNQIEDRLRTLLGEPLLKHRCFHLCPVHPEDKKLA